MDYKIFITRFISSLFLLSIILPVIIFNKNLLIILVFILYFIIIYEVNKFFNFKKILIYIYLFSSLISSEIYLIFFFDEKFIFFIFTIILFDTFSYIFGSLFGNKKIFSNISPNKTYVGLIFGYIFTIITIFCLNNYFDFFEKNYKFFIIISLIILFSFFGDLIESFFKRKSNLKNSSFLLPGHGGFFDRFDSYIFASFILPILFLS